MRRHWAIYQQARALVDSGELGAPRAVIGYSGNSIGGHYLDTLLYLIGDPEPVSIQGTLGQLYPAEGDSSGMRFVKDTIIRSALVEFANGTTLHAIGAATWGEFEVICDSALIRIQNDGESILVRRKAESKNAYDPYPLPPVPNGSGTERKIRELVESIRTGKDGASNLHATMLGTEIGFGIYESHLRGGVAVRPPVPNRERWVSSW
jgi:predicted dehydrogenase